MTPQGRDRALAEARQIIVRTELRSIDRDYLTAITAGALDVPLDYIWPDLDWEAS